MRLVVTGEDRFGRTARCPVSQLARAWPPQRWTRRSHASGTSRLTWYCQPCLYLEHRSTTGSMDVRRSGVCATKRRTRTRRSHLSLRTRERVSDVTSASVTGPLHRRYARPGWKTRNMTGTILTYATRIALAVTLVATLAATPAAATAADGATHSLTDASAQTIGDSFAGSTMDADLGGGIVPGPDDDSEDEGSRYPPFSPPQ